MTPDKEILSSAGLDALVSSWRIRNAGVARNGTAWHCMDWHGMAWHGQGMALHGIDWHVTPWARHGTAWHGTPLCVFAEDDGLHQLMTEWVPRGAAEG